MLDGIQRQQTPTTSSAAKPAPTSGKDAKVQARALADQGFLAQERALSPDGVAGEKGGEPKPKEEVVVTTRPLTLIHRHGEAWFMLAAGSRLRIGAAPSAKEGDPDAMATVFIEGLIRVLEGGTFWNADVRDNHVKDHTLTRDHFDTKVRDLTCTFITGTRFDPRFYWATGKAENGRPQTRRFITQGQVYAPGSPLLQWRISGSDLATLRPASAPK